MNRREQIAGALSLLANRLAAPVSGLAAAAMPAGLAQAAKRPSILVIQTDDMRVDDVQAMPKTRELLAARGMTFQNFIIPTPWCNPSRASALTGLYPHNHSMPDGRSNFTQFREAGHEGRTIAVALRQVGYRTAFLGKYLNGYPASSPGSVPDGWARWFAFAGTKKCATCSNTGGRYYDYRINDNGRARIYGDKPGAYSTDVLTRRARAIIRDTPRTTPLFLWVNPYAPHGPSIPAPRHRQTDVLRQRRTPAFNTIGTGKAPWMRQLPPLNRSVRGYIGRTTRDRRRTLRAVDAMVAELISARPRDSYVFFFSDNGYMRGELRIPLGKHLPYRPSAEVPLLVLGPDISRGSVSQTVTSVIDLAPTWAEIAGATLPWPVDGVSLLPVLRGEATPARDSILLEWHAAGRAEAMALEPDVLPAELLAPEPGASSDSGTTRADPIAPDYVPPPYFGLRGANWLYLEWQQGGHKEYYDYADQPFELNNQYQSLSPERQAELAARVQLLVSCQGQAEATTCTRSGP